MAWSSVTQLSMELHLAKNGSFLQRRANLKKITLQESVTLIKDLLSEFSYHVHNSRYL